MASDAMQDLVAEMARLQAENAALRRAAESALRFKVSDKGAVSVYGLNRMPTTLYAEQWERVLGERDALLAFIEDNRARLRPPRAAEGGGASAPAEGAQ